jgi:hypothetical protein
MSASREEGYGMINLLVTLSTSDVLQQSRRWLVVKSENSSNVEPVCQVYSNYIIGGMPNSNLTILDRFLFRLLYIHQTR